MRRNLKHITALMLAMSFSMLCSSAGAAEAIAGLSVNDTELIIEEQEDYSGEASGTSDFVSEADTDLPSDDTGLIISLEQAEEETKQVECETETIGFSIEQSEYVEISAESGNQENDFGENTETEIAPVETTELSASSDELLLYGNASVLSDNIIQLTPLDFHQSGSVWINNTFNTTAGLTVEFSYWAGGGHDNWAGGADGIVLIFSQSTGLGADGTALGFIEGSYGVEFDSYYYEGNDPDGKHVAIIYDTILNHLAYQLDSRVDDETWHSVVIEYEPGSMVVKLDGAEEVSASVILPDTVYIGACATTGNGYNQQLISDLRVNSNECSHTWDDGVITAAATSTTDEVTTYKCTSCGETVSVTLKKTDFTYDGKEKSVTPVIYDSSGTIVETVTTIEYGSADSVSVTYSGPPVNAGNYECTISVLGKYNLVWHRKFVIEPATIDPLMSSITDSSFIYDGTKKETAILIKDYNYNVLVKDTDYTVKYSPDNVNAGTVNVTVTGKGNYQGTKTGAFRIVAQAVTSDQVLLSALTYTYDGAAHQPTVAAYDKYGRTVPAGNYTVTYSGSGIEAGTYTVTVKFKGNYQGTIQKNFVVKPAETAQVVLSKTSYTYNGKKHQPTVKVYDESGNIVPSENYTVSYSGTGKKPGTYSVTVKFKGDYQGTVQKNYTVNLAGTSIKKLTAVSKGFTVKWKKASKQVDGYQIQYSTSKKFSGKVTKTVKKYNVTSLKIRGLKAKKKYYVRIRAYKTISGKKYYSTWSAVNTVKTKK